MKQLILLTFSFILLTCLPSIGQLNTPDSTQIFEKKNLAIKGKYTEEGVIIRWAPLLWEIWSAGKDQGYVLEKMVLDSTTKDLGFTPLEKDKIKPWPLDRWKSFLAKGDTISLIAAQGIYGDNELDYQEAGILAASQALENVYGFSLLAADYSRECAEASGLLYVDKNIEKNKMYIYRLCLANPIADVPNDTVYVNVITSNYKTLKPPISIKSANEEKSVNLQWQNQYSNKFSGYYIERSEDNKHFSRLNKTPYVELKSDLTKSNAHIGYRDKVAENYTKYYYRVQGIDPFGDLSPYTEVVMGMGVDKTAPASPVDITTQIINNEEVIINWKYESEAFEADMAGFQVLHSTSSNYGFEVISEGIIDRGANEYRHQNPILNKENYYMVAAVDTAGNRGESVRVHAALIDKIPPAAPVGLSGSIDSNGIVSIVWDMGEEVDLGGYDIYFANQADHIFSKKNNKHLSQNAFRDSIQIKTLTSEIFYYVIALDHSYNASKKSEILALKRPDIITPIAPLFKSYKVSSEAIYLEWIPSQSEDVSFHTLERKNAEGIWEPIEIDVGQNSYTDYQVIENEYLVYRISATDDAGLVSFCPDNLKLQASGPYFIPEPKNININQENGGIKLSWEYEDISKHEFVVYRSINDKKLKTLKIVKNQTFLIDAEVKEENNYKYAVKAVRADGKESQISNLISN